MPSLSCRHHDDSLRKAIGVFQMVSDFFIVFDLNRVSKKCMYTGICILTKYEVYQSSLTHIRLKRCTFREPHPFLKNSHTHKVLFVS